MPGWLAPSLVGVLIVLVTVPRLRRGGLRGLSPEAPLRSAPPAGVALILGVLGGLLFESSLRSAGALVFVVATLLGSVGVLDDETVSGSSLRLAAVGGAALAAVVVGVSVPETGSDPLNVVLTMAWIVFVTNGFAALGRFDGVAPGVGAAASLGVFGVALVSAQPVVATAAATTAAACLTFLIFNRPPAWVAIGPGGSLFLGFTLAMLSLSLDPGGGAAARLLLPFALLALPVTVTGVETVARLRQALPGSGERRFRPRLVRGGWSDGQALLALVAAEAAMVALAVILSGRAVPPLVTVLLGGAVLYAVRVAGIGVFLHDEDQPAEARRVTPALLPLGAVVVLLSAPAVLALLRAEAPAKTAHATAKRATAALEAGDASVAVKEFERAAEQFAVAKRRMSGPLPQLSMVVPVLSANVSAARATVTIGEELSRAASMAGKLAEPDALPIVNGKVVLEEVRPLVSALTATSGVIERSRRRLDRVQQAFLLPPLNRGVDDLSMLLDDHEEVLELGAEAAQLLPTLLGEDRPKRYFIAFQNSSELRGTGGFLGNWGELVADAGQLRLARFGRLSELQSLLMAKGPATIPESIQRRWGTFDIARQWQQVNLSPDFPATADVIDALYTHCVGHPVDGVIAIDPVGLAALLGVTGPISVPSWPEPITSANVVDVTLVQAYERFPTERDSERIAFLGDVTLAVTEAFTQLQSGSARQLMASLSAAVRGRHLMVYTKDRRTQQLLRDIGADGGVPFLEGDALFVVNQNFAANKIDTYLHRAVRYEIELAPRNGKASVSGRGEVALTNAVPSLALPDAVLGPYMPHFRKGENRTYVSVYSPFLTGSVTVDGEPADAESHFDLGRSSRSLTMSLDAGQTRTVGFTVRGQTELGDRTWYRLDLPRQATLNADTYDVTVAVPRGWRIAGVQGAEATGSYRRASVHIRTTEAETLWVKVEPTGTNRLWHRLLA